MRALLLCSLLVLTAAAPAQVAEVPNTGCPTATAPTALGAPRIGQRLVFSWSCWLSTRQAIAMLGAASGGGYRFDQPFSCFPGPCVWYPGPIGGLYHAWPAVSGGGTWALDIPNDARLVGTQWGIQCICWCP